jgi:hypothetical protein
MSRPHNLGHHQAPMNITQVIKINGYDTDPYQPLRVHWSVIQHWAWPGRHRKHSLIYCCVLDRV